MDKYFCPCHHFIEFPTPENKYMNITQIIAEELNLAEPIVGKVLSLFVEGNTVPFVARYRKEVTGGLDEVILRKIEERNIYLGELLERKETVKKTIVDLGKMTPELEKTIRDCLSKNELEASCALHRIT